MEILFQFDRLDRMWEEMFKHCYWMIFVVKRNGQQENVRSINWHRLLIECPMWNICHGYWCPICRKKIFFKWIWLILINGKVFYRKWHRCWISIFWLNVRRNRWVIFLMISFEFSRKFPRHPIEQFKSKWIMPSKMKSGVFFFSLELSSNSLLLFSPFWKLIFKNYIKSMEYN